MVVFLRAHLFKCIFSVIALMGLREGIHEYLTNRALYRPTMKRLLSISHRGRAPGSFISEPTSNIKKADESLPQNGKMQMSSISEPMPNMMKADANLPQRGKEPGSFISAPMPNIVKASSKLTSKVHIATSANDEYLEGVIGLIKSAYRKSRTPGLIQFEIFLTPEQDASAIEHLAQGNEAQVDNWSIRIHRFTEEEVDKYVNRRFDQNIDGCKTCHERGKLKTAHNWVRYILFKRLHDVDYCFWMDADMCVNKDIIQFVIEKTRTASEWDSVKTSLEKVPTEYGLYGNSFREKYVIGAFSSFKDGNYRKAVYEKLKQNHFDVQRMPNFNAGFLIINLDLWRKKNIDREMIRLAKVNNILTLWTDIGSQAPLNLLLGGKKFFPLPGKAIQQTLGFQAIRKPRKEAYFLHWNGIHKPWMDKGLNKNFWPL